MAFITKEKVRTLEELKTFINRTIECTCEYPEKDVEEIIRRNNWESMSMSEHGICITTEKIMQFTDDTHTQAEIYTIQED